MGCCSSENNYPPEELNKRLLDCFTSGSPKRLEYYISLKLKNKEEKFNINSFTIENNKGQQLSLLSLSFLFGRLDFIKLIVENYNGSLAEMEKCLGKFGYSGLRVICENNYLEVFEYYAAAYLACAEIQRAESFCMAKDTVCLGTNDTVQGFLSRYPDGRFSPVHYACILGNISIIKAVSSFAGTLNSVPLEFDVNYVELGYGFNCALIACIQVNYNMIKFLHNSCRSDFGLISYNKESNLQLLLEGATENSSQDLYNCFTYLVEKIKANVNYNYEDLLNACEVFKLTDYYVQKLIELGVDVNKKEVEEKRKKNKISRFGSFRDSQEAST